MSHPLTADMMEAQAAEQRRQIHSAVAELKLKVRETLDVKRQARQYLAPAAGALAFVGLLLGYAVAGMFRRR